MSTTEAGRELDALVAEHVFGLKPDCWHWELEPVRGSLSRCVQCGEEFGQTTYAIWWGQVYHYSTDIAAAWLVVEKMKERGYAVELRDDTRRVLPGAPGWWTSFVHEDRSYGTALAGAAPRAICIAALRVLNVEVPA